MRIAPTPAEPLQVTPFPEAQAAPPVGGMQPAEGQQDTPHLGQSLTERLRAVSWRRVGGTLLAGTVALGTLTGCEDDRGSMVDVQDPIPLDKGTAVFDYSSEEDTTAEKCGETKANVRPYPRREYTDPQGTEWWGFSGATFSTTGNCETLGILWVKK